MCEFYGFICDVETYFTHTSQNDDTYCKIKSQIIFLVPTSGASILNDFVAMRKIEHSQKNQIKIKCF